MAFMQKQIVKGLWLDVENTHGEGTLIPADLVSKVTLGKLALDVVSEDPEILDAVRDYVNGEAREVTLREGYGARLSAPGYMDCTEWALYPTVEAARAGLAEMYGDDDDDDDTEGEG